MGYRHPVQRKISNGKAILQHLNDQPVGVLLAFTIATIPTFRASGNKYQRSAIVAKSGDVAARNAKQDAKQSACVAQVLEFPVDTGFIRKSSKPVRVNAPVGSIPRHSRFLVSLLSFSHLFSLGLHAAHS